MAGICAMKGESMALCRAKCINLSAKVKNFRYQFFLEKPTENDDNFMKHIIKIQKVLSLWQMRKLTNLTNLTNLDSTQPVFTC